MTDHECAAMIMAIDDGRPEAMAWNSKHEEVAERVWRAARKYEPPAVCGERHSVYECSLPQHDTGDHRHNFDNGSYFGWPRK